MGYSICLSGNSPLLINCSISYTNWGHPVTEDQRDYHHNTNTALFTLSYKKTTFHGYYSEAGFFFLVSTNKILLENSRKFVI